MRGVPNRIFPTGGYMGVFFTFFIGKVVRFSSCTNCQHKPALLSVLLIGPRDRHLSMLQLMTRSPMTHQDVPPLLTLSGAALEAQWDRVSHITLSDLCRRPVGREKKNNRDVSFV